MIDQAGKLREFFEGDARALILFDAARYDVFEEVYPEYFRGKLLKVHNGGATWTLPWLVKHCQGNYNCTLYSANPAFSGGVGYLSKWFKETYEPRKHFKHIIPWQTIGFNYKLGTAMPRSVTRAVLESPDSKMLVHYLQPHIPLIGNPPMPWTRGGGVVELTKRKLASGELTIGKLREAYKGNMRLALEGAVELVEKLDGKFYITSDHGEALGENGHFFHWPGYPQLDCLCHVPFFEVEGLR